MTAKTLKPSMSSPNPSSRPLSLQPMTKQEKAKHRLSNPQANSFSPPLLEGEEIESEDPTTRHPHSFSFSPLSSSSTTEAFHLPQAHLQETHLQETHESLPTVLRPHLAKTKMLKAVKDQEYSLVWALLGKGADPNECDDPSGSGAAPLHYAAKDGNLALVQLLVSKGADVNIRDKSGQTPLHRAAYWGKFSVVDFLVYVGANFKATDSLNQTAEEIAFHRNNVEVYHLLADARTHPTKRTKTWSVKRQFEQLLKDQAKEEKLLRKNEKLEEKLRRLVKETQHIQMIQQELGKRGKVLPKKEELRLERLGEKKHVVGEEIRKNSIEITIARSVNFEKYAQENKIQTWMSFLEEY